jgi:predicted TIM-barrel fold metal-dependent hydrolase
MWDRSVLDRVEKALKKDIYRGLGEIHIFAKDRHSAVLAGLLKIAKQHQLILMVHGDAEVLDTIFTIAPEIKVIWAHLGTKPEVGLLRKMLTKYPENLYIDTSVRDKQLLETGGLNKDWKQLFIDYQDRFMVAIDTFSVNRWQSYALVVKDINDWLDDLPEEVAQKIAFDNAYKLLVKQK